MIKKISKFFWLGLINGLLLFSYLSYYMQAVIYFPPEYRTFAILSKIIFTIYFIANFVIYLKFTKNITKPRIKELLLITVGIIIGYTMHAIKLCLSIFVTIIMCKLSIPCNPLSKILFTSYFFDIKTFLFLYALPMITYLSADFIRFFIKYLIKKNKQLEEEARERRQNGPF